MKSEKLEQAKKFNKEILEQKDLLKNVKKLLPQDENEVEVRIRGTIFKLSKGLFAVELDKKIKGMEKNIKDLEQQLDKL